LANSLPHLVEKALVRGGGNYTLPDLVSLVRDGEAQAFQNGNSTVVTQIADYPGNRELVLWVAAGDWPEILAMTDEIKQYGRENGCTRAVSYSHPALAKKMKAHGFKEALRVYTMEL
jgi:hypothetical protein